MDQNNKIVTGIVSVLLLGFFSGCNKTELTLNQASMKEYNFNNADMTVEYMEQVSANQLLIIGSETNNAYVMRTDLKGNLISHKTIVLPDTFNGNNFIGLGIRSMHNGTYLCNRQFYGKFMLIDSSGKFLWDAHDSVSIGTESNAVYSSTKNEYILGQSNGGATGAYSSNYLDFYNSSHTFTGRYTYPDTTFIYGKTMTINPIGSTKNGEYKVYGTKILHFDANYSAPTRIYVGTTAGQYLKTRIIDSGATGISDTYYDFFINPSDSGIIIYGNRNNINMGVNSILFLRFDANLAFLGEGQYNYKNLNTTPVNMCQCRDGGYLICGYYNPGGLINNLGAGSFAQPYLVRIDKNGNKLWDKGFSMPSSELFLSVLELSDGSIMIGSIAYGFGKNLAPGANILLMKLDANGNLVK